MYQWKAFKTLEEAKQFKGKNKRGVIYDLNKDRKRVEHGRPPCSVAIICGVNPALNYSVEWTV